MTSKPIIETSGFWLSDNPSKNYLFHLLLRDIRACEPSRSLDAGSGELRNYWMFPGKYVGISHNRPAYLRGLNRGFNQKMIAPDEQPEVYLMRLERDFSFLGLFDLCVCTRTIAYVRDPMDVANRLAQSINKGGTFILTDEIERAENYVRLLANEFASIDVIYVGRREADIVCKNMPKLPNMATPGHFNELFELEMRSPNEPDGHSQVYLRATSKKHAAVSQCSAPEFLREGGLRIVKDDIPQLKMTD